MSSSRGQQTSSRTTKPEEPRDGRVEHDYHDYSAVVDEFQMHRMAMATATNGSAKLGGANEPKAFPVR